MGEDSIKKGWSPLPVALIFVLGLHVADQFYTPKECMPYKEVKENFQTEYEKKKSVIDLDYYYKKKARGDCDWFGYCPSKDDSLGRAHQTKVDSLDNIFDKRLDSLHHAYIDCYSEE